MQETTAKRKFENANLEGERLGERLIESLRMQKEGRRRGREGRERSVYDGLYLSFSIGASDAAAPVNRTRCLYAIG